ncbi:AAA family ATPase [Methanomethylovorans sp.]|uniref:AAA family ATPase n=1 Tax=Methanomethylovorans sp. TaxID=2758717 RepID=UPI003C782BE2
MKYRPSRLEELVGNEESANTLHRLALSRNVPHLLLYGPANSGKATAAFALAYELYGEGFERNFTYFNSSDFFDKGKSYLVRDKRFTRILGTDDPRKVQKSVISVFKEIINEYASMAPIDSDYKIIFIDSSETLDVNAQHALRRMMEKYTATCRFILSTTQPSRLISPLRSRGLQLFFRHVSDEKLENFIKRISEAEGVLVTEDGIQALLYHSRGNVASSLDTLQVAVILSDGGPIGTQAIYDAVIREEIPEIQLLFEAFMAGNITEARKIIDRMLIDNGFTGSEILERLHRTMVASGEPEHRIARWTIKVADANFKMLQAANDRIQLEALAADFCN